MPVSATATGRGGGGRYGSAREGTGRGGGTGSDAAGGVVLAAPTSTARAA